VPAKSPKTPADERWLNRGVGAIGSASLLSDLGHEVPTSLLPSLLTSTLGAPAAALGLIEGVADALAGAAKLAGGALADDPERRRATAVGGYTATAVLSSAIGLATAAWQVGVLRSGAWIARGIRGPSRNALLADVVVPSAYGRAYGFERAMDNLGAIGGPLLALALVATVGVRTAILLSIIPGLLAAVAMVVGIRAAQQHLCKARDAGEGRVHFVCDASGKQTDRGHLVGDLQLLLEMHALGDIFDDDDVPHRRHAQGVARRLQRGGRNVDPQALAGLRGARGQRDTVQGCASRCVALGGPERFDEWAIEHVFEPSPDGTTARSTSSTSTSGTASRT